MVRLGGVELSNLAWVDQFQWSPVAQTVKVTLGGRPIVFSVPLVKGQPITLQAEESYGWLTKDMVDSLVSMASASGAVYSLEFGATVTDVVFRHEDPPALEIQPLIARETYTSDDYFIGKIKLLTV